MHSRANAIRLLTNETVYCAPAKRGAKHNGMSEKSCAITGRRNMARTLLASIAAMVLTTIASPGWSQAPAQPTAPSAQPGAAAGQPSRPQIETRKVDGTENVYIFRNGNHQAMFIVTPEGVIATDPVAYGRPTGGQQYIDEIKKVTQAPIRYLIYSHHHFDHIAGGKAFKDAGATIVAHKRAKERLEVLKDPHTPLPDETVDSDRTITLGGTTLELTYVGPNIPTRRWSSGCQRRRSSSSSISFLSAGCQVEA